MALSTAYLNAAAEKREPVIVVRVENPDGNQIDYTTQADWAGSATLTDVDTNEIVGSAIQGTTIEVATVYTVDPDTTKNQAVIAVPFDGWLTRIVARVLWNPDSPNTRTAAKLLIKKGSPFTYYGSFPAGYRESEADYVTEAIDIVADGKIGSWYATASFPVTPNTTNDAFLSTDTLYVVGELGTTEIDAITYLADDDLVVFVDGYFSDTSGTLTTSTIDFGEVLADPPTIAIEDVRPFGADLVYTAFGGNADPPATNLGTVTDGDTVGGSGYRYYRVQVDFTTTNGARAEVSQISLIGGAPSTVALSTHRDLPDSTVWPLLPKDAVGTLSSKIELDKPTSVGEVSFRCLWTKALGDLIYTGALKNKAVTIKQGFAGLSEAEYATIFVGTWANYRADHRKKVVTVSVQNALRRFMEVKLPRETFSASGTKTTTSIVKTSVNAVQVILDLLEELEVPDRYIDRTTLEGLRDGALAGPEYDVTRTIAKPTEAWRLIWELATLCGGWIAVTGEGRVTLRLYSDDPSTATFLDARFVDLGELDGGQDNLYTRQVVYYDPNISDPGDRDEDYDQGYLLINAASEIAYGESREQRWYDKWSASATVNQALAARRDTWGGSPRLRFSAGNVSMRFGDLVEGQTVRVKGATVPANAANYESESEMTALILRRGFSPSKCTLDFELLQLSEAYPGFTTGFSLGFRS